MTEHSPADVPTDVPDVPAALRLLVYTELAPAATGDRTTVDPVFAAAVAAEVANLRAGSTPHWIYIQRQYGPDLFIGPYPSDAVAAHAMEDALLIDGFCEEDCLDCFVTTDSPTADLQVIFVDLSNPDHVGRG